MFSVSADSKGLRGEMGATSGEKEEKSRSFATLRMTFY
jgi:hypothetical protein